MVLPQPSQAFFWTQEPWGAALKSAALAEVAPLHLFTSSAVSVSRDPSDPGLAAVAASLGLRPDAIVQAHQVHGREVLVVQKGTGTFMTRGTGTVSEKVPLPISVSFEADALVSDDPQRAVGVRVADCAPILMADRRTGAVAAVHAGWRGTAVAVVRAALDSMSAGFGTAPRDVVVAIGPSIRSCCYEVGPDLRAAFAEAGHARVALDRWFTEGTGDRLQLDVVRANRDQLEAAGVPTTQIHDSGLCTLCQADAASRPDINRLSDAPPASGPQETTIVLHSYRRAGSRAGRMLGVIRSRT